jgi:hypothetical protein
MKLADRVHCREANGHSARTNGMGDRLNILRALELIPNGRGDDDEVLPSSGADDPLPQWLVEKWPGRRDGQRLRSQPAQQAAG